MEEKENIWRRRRRRTTEKKKEGNIWRRKILFCGGEGKGGKYLEQENIFWTRRLKTEKEKEGNNLEKDIIFFGMEKNHLKRRQLP